MYVDTEVNGFTLVPLNTDIVIVPGVVLNVHNVRGHRGIVIVPGVVLNVHNVRGHRGEWVHTRTLKYRYSYCSWCCLECAQCTWTQR